LERDYNIALYLRVSTKEQGDSIENQRALLKKYIEEREELKGARVLEFIDEGCSGTHLQRKGFLKMEDAIKNKKIDCILVKDLSRLGRNYKEIGYYIEEKYPERNIRILSVLDSYDSEEQSWIGMDIPFRNIMYELYSRDLSYKIKAGLEAGRKRGKFLGGLPPYGYKRTKGNKYKLCIDKEAASIVKEVFEKTCNGISKREIACHLNSRGISPPYEYLEKKYRGRKAEEKKRWNEGSIYRIIKNPIYTGCVVNGRKKVKTMGSKKKKNMNRKEWIIVEDTHEAIISKEMFERAQNKMPRMYTVQKRENKL